ncbi:DM13 domain-containing protein [Jiulongibacter sp. NS-SX5]|uniref:DM13 domain-containing protein n=1 Tax=Jiulongibacter sp. NS-SX5 TaxID=3463854 RepID=UPI00405A21B7
MAACNVDKVNPAVEINPTDESEDVIAEGSTVLFEGDFIDAAHPTSGRASVIRNQDNTLSLVFSDFKTDPGPDLRVYLAEDDKATGFKEISKEVKNGNVKYNLPDGTDPAQMNHVLIWCRAFSVNFGTAVLKSAE